MRHVPTKIKLSKTILVQLFAQEIYALHTFQKIKRLETPT